MTNTHTIPTALRVQGVTIPAIATRFLEKYAGVKLKPEEQRIVDLRYTTLAYAAQLQWQAFGTFTYSSAISSESVISNVETLIARIDAANGKTSAFCFGTIESGFGKSRRRHAHVVLGGIGRVGVDCGSQKQYRPGCSCVRHLIGARNDANKVEAYRPADNALTYIVKELGTYSEVFYAGSLPADK